MKYSVNAILTSTLMVVAASSAQAAGNFKEARYVGDTAFANFCKAAVNDDVRILRSSINRQVGKIGVSEKQVIRLVTGDNGLTCNGESLLNFSKQRDAKEVYSFLTTYNR